MVLSNKDSFAIPKHHRKDESYARSGEGYSRYPRKENRDDHYPDRELHWREKDSKIASREVVLYKPDASQKNHHGDNALQQVEHENETCGRSQSPIKKLASKIVTPSYGNVTIRNRSIVKALTFPSESDIRMSPPRDAQVIGALKEMGSNSQTGMEEEDANMDDMLGEELMEMEQRSTSKTESYKSKATAEDKAKAKPRRDVSSRNNIKKSATWGVLTIKFHRIRRGSPS
ncbi:unnamed protein product [Eruca vesicaria subsp. sativa]|uniref:Uncharacterized protein n=1 Tax=Eruca vesicaria subsp. sativa TaxID=29727 RepID=A0ABC8JYF6_ERUVS|nr:unnamed protein product [Eruca vesicaria subsp. sativa]